MPHVRPTECPLKFAESWYRPEDIQAAISFKNRRSSLEARIRDIPPTTDSREFAEWMAVEYQLAMVKGIQLAMQDLGYRGESSEGNMPENDSAAAKIIREAAERAYLLLDGDVTAALAFMRGAALKRMRELAENVAGSTDASNGD